MKSLGICNCISCVRCAQSPPSSCSYGVRPPPKSELCIHIWNLIWPQKKINKFVISKKTRANQVFGSCVYEAVIRYTPNPLVSRKVLDGFSSYIFKLQNKGSEFVFLHSRLPSRNENRTYVAQFRDSSKTTATGVRRGYIRMRCHETNRDMWLCVDGNKQLL